jgi:hypothetical protein
MPEEPDPLAFLSQLYLQPPQHHGASKRPRDEPLNRKPVEGRKSQSMSWQRPELVRQERYGKWNVASRFMLWGW